MKHHVTHIKKSNPVEETVDKIPDFKKFGRAAKLRFNPDIVPYLGWEHEAAEVSTIACSEKSTFSTKWKLISKILILHSCVKFIYSSKPQKTLKMFNRYHKVMRCLCNTNTNNVSVFYSGVIADKLLVYTQNKIVVCVNTHGLCNHET